MKLKLTVNGVARELDGAWGGESLLYALRERLGLPGSKNACEQGECGSCSVYLDGTLVCSCLVLAAQAAGRKVVTVEGLAPEGELHPIQRAFIDAGAVQCGFCTPGLIVASHDLLQRDPRPTEAEIREALAGNLCRCTGYAKIIDAVNLAADRLAGAA
jgi:carbon-monoxide dehydrogenase small subunit